MEKITELPIVKKIKTILLYTILISAAIFVLLPLIWMSITALKEPGKALKMEFFPKTTKLVYSDQFNFPFNDIYAYFEYKGSPNATTVSVAGDFNNWKTDLAQMKINTEGVWSVKIKNIQSGEHQYKFVINGLDWINDPKNSKEKDGNSVIMIYRDKISYNTSQLIYGIFPKKDGHLEISYKNPSITGAEIRLNGKKYKLKKKGDYWIRNIQLVKGNNKVEIFTKESWLTGMDKIYTIRNFKEVLFNDDFPFIRFFINSLIVASLAALLTAIICTMAGYAFAKKNFTGKEIIFWSLMASMMIPGMMFMIPQFAIVNKLGWMNSYRGMIIPHIANVFGLFLLRQYITTIPNSLFEAAKIDGAGEIGLFRIIVLPLSKSIIITLFLLTFVGQWSNFLWQLIVNTPDSPLRTLPVGLALFKGQYAIEWEKMMAGASFSIIPIALLFLAAQNVFIEGMTAGAVKE